MLETKRENTFAKQAAILATANFVARFIGFLYRVPLTNLIGDVGIGIYSNGYYIYTFFLILSSAGLPVSISKMVSARIADKEYRNAHEVFKVSLFIGGGIGLAFAIFMALGAKGLANLIGSPKSYLTILTLAPTIFIVAVMSSFRGYFQGMQNTVPTAISQLIEQIVNAIFSIILAYILIEHSIAYAAAGATAATGIGALAGLIVVFIIYKLVKPKIFKRIDGDLDRKNYESNKIIGKELLLTSMPIIIGSAVFSLTNIIDMVMVKNILTNNGFQESVAEALYGQLSGKYNTLTTLPVTISTSLATASIPAIASSVRLRKTKDVHKKINTAMRLAMILSIPAATGIGVLGDQILMLLFPRHSDGGMLLRVGAVSIIFLALTQITTGMLQGIGKVNIPVFAAIAGGIVKVISNSIFIPMKNINVVGAVISTVLCYFVASGIDIYFLKKHTKVNLDFKAILVKPIFSSVVMGISCYAFYYIIFLFTKRNAISVLFAIVLGMLVYFIMMVLVHGFKKEDILSLPKGQALANFLENLKAF